MAKPEKNFRDFCERRDGDRNSGKFIRILADFIMFFPYVTAVTDFRHDINALTNVTYCNIP
ncbi:hypothetical protein RHECIAT_CH0000344 [Rhizobium etli CIAT 652]|uniref:Uncharacterized protein n=1 Tax=Rhizobium etli (strain CIAT 652) TaxID=491916 RepID=B3PYI7_RHIE6|nr:hypothetical protein RHECIAT_CH0000344 [Rhizobium etli CIAT 652]